MFYCCKTLSAHHYTRYCGYRRTDSGHTHQPRPLVARGSLECANFHVPRKGGIFEDVLYAEIYGVAADKIVRQYREDALGLPSYPTTKRGRYDRSPSDRGGRFGSPRSGGRGGGYSPYPPYGRGPPYGYGYSRGPAYPPYHRPPPPPHHMYPPRGGYGGGGGHYGHHSPYAPRPYGGRGGYGPPPHRGGGGGYYGRY